MRSILLALATVATAKLPPAFPPFAHNDSTAYVYREEILDHPLKHVGIGACAAARKPAVPTRADLCYGVVDREIVATKCA